MTRVASSQREGAPVKAPSKMSRVTSSRRTKSSSAALGYLTTATSREEQSRMRSVDVAATKQGESHTTCCDETRGCFGGEEQKAVVYSESGHVAKYDAGRLYRMGLVVFLRGTVFDDPFMWLQILLMMCVSVGIAVLLFVLEVPEEVARAHMERLIIIAGSMQALTAFFLGLFVSLVIMVWKEVRYGALSRYMGAVINISTVVGHAFAGDEQRLKALRMRVMRYILLTFSLMCMEARDDVRLAELLEAKLVTVPEVAVLKTAPVMAQSVVVWISTLVIAAVNEGLGTFNDRKLFLESVFMARGAVGDCHMLVSAQLPLPYTALIAAVVKFTLLVETLRGGAELYVASFEDLWEVMNTALMMLLFGVVYQGCLNLHLVLSNPFGYDTSDFPQSKLFRDLASSVHTQLATPTMAASLAADVVSAPNPVALTPAKSPAQMPGLFSRARSGSERLWEAIAEAESARPRPGANEGDDAPTTELTLEVPQSQLGWPATLQTPDSPPRRRQRGSNASSRTGRLSARRNTDNSDVGVLRSSGQFVMRRSGSFGSGSLFNARTGAPRITPPRGSTGSRSRVSSGASSAVDDAGQSAGHASAAAVISAPSLPPIPNDGDATP